MIPATSGAAADALISRRPALSELRAVVSRDWQIARSYRAAFALEIVVGAVSLLIYFYISKVFENASSAELQGAPSYFAFASVGVAIGVVAHSTAIGVARRVREEQLTGTLEALVAQPVSSSKMAIAFAGYPFLVATARAAVYLFVADVLLGADYSGAEWEGVVAGLVATALALTAIGVLLGALSVVVKRSEILASIVISLLVLAGGAYFPVSVLPGWVESITIVLPTRLAFDGIRAALFVGGDWADSVLGLLLFALLALPLAIWCFDRALTRARRSGTLGQY